jgi:hypothetical protein
MAVMPIVRLFFPCAHIDENGEGSITIVDPIDSIFLPPGIEENFTLGPIYLYVQVKEGLGSFYFRVEVKEERGRRLARTKPMQVTFSRKNHNVAEGLIFIVRDLHLAEPCVVRFELFANEVLAATCDVRIIAPGELP